MAERWAPKLNLDDITPAMLEEGVWFNHRGFFPGGYDEREVDEFLDLLAEWAANLMRERDELRIKAGVPNDRYREYGVKKEWER